MKSYLSYWRKFLTHSILFVSLCFTFAVNAAIDNKGKEFIMAYLPNFDNTAVAEIHLTSDVATSVTVNYPMTAPTFTTVVAVTPGDVAIVTLPITTHFGWSADTVTDNLVHATADEEFVAYQINRRTFSTDAALALPIDTMNTEYIVSTYDSTVGSEFIVYAAFDNTELTITPNNNITGHAAGTSFNISLDRGEGYYALSTGSGSSGSLMGTTVSSDRPVGLINGNKCVNVPQGTSFCDHIFEVAQPVVSWGLTASAANLPNRNNGTVYRILASEDNTSVSINGVSQGSINRGEHIETPSLIDNQFFEGDKPIFVTQYMTGSSSPGATLGDPAMANITPSAQYQNGYTFSTVGGNQFVENYLTIIANNADVGSLTLDGSAIPAGDYTPVPGQPLSSAIVPLTDGPHTTMSTNPHGITVEGYNQDDSYIYPGGALFEFINPIGDGFDPVCAIDTIITETSAAGSVKDNKPSEDINGNGILDIGEDTNGNGVIDEDTGVFFVEVINPVNATVTIAPFTPGDGEATFLAQITVPGQEASVTIKGTDGAGNTCQLDIEIFGAASTEPSCDADIDGDIDRDDIMLIRAERNRPASPADPVNIDIDGDGMITMNDARKCATQCTNAGCAANN